MHLRGDRRVQSDGLYAGAQIILSTATPADGALLCDPRLQAANNVRAFCELENELATHLETTERLDQHWMIRHEIYRTGYLEKRDVSNIFEFLWFYEAIKFGIRSTH